jgi:hypothetical protein
MTQSSYAIPIRKLVDESAIPGDFITAPGGLSGLLDKIYFSEFSVIPGVDRIGLLIELLIVGEVSIGIPGMDTLALVFGSDSAGSTSISAVFSVSERGVRLVFRDLVASLRFPPGILNPVSEAGGEAVREYAQIELRGSLLIDETFSVRFLGFDSLRLGPVMIGNTGIIISADNVKLDLSRTESLPEVTAAGFGDSFLGVYIGAATVKLPPGLPALVPADLKLKKCVIGSGGVSGILDAHYKPVYDSTAKIFSGTGAGFLFDIPFGLEDITVEFRSNCLAQSTITGKMLLPFFDEPVDVDLGFDLDGNLTVALTSTGPDGLRTLEKAEILKLELDSIAFEVKDGLFVAKVSGKLQPLFGAADGLKWPTFDLKELSIDSKGNVHLEGGWLPLAKQYTLNFHGFKLEISKLGFGKTDDGGQFIGFSGGLKLVDGLPAGASVEGLRIVWYPNGHTSLTLKGLGVEFKVPEVLHFKGAVSYDDTEKRFTGDIKLEIDTPKLTVDGTLVIGSNGGSPYFAIYLDADLPSGIPLGSTGLAIYGMAGLFALQMEPNKAPGEEWYSLEAGKSWYHRPGVGVTDIAKKWHPSPGSLGLGAGLTLATMADNGYSFNGKFMLVLVFPGPIIMLQGSANLLKKRSEATEDALFRALAVFDGRESTVLIGIDAEYKTGKQGQLIEIQAGAEAFYSFNDPSAWYIDLGKDEPREQRIRALFGRFVEVDAYFMLNAHRLALGAWFGYDRKWEAGPLSITLQAWADGNALVSFKPAQFHGDLWIHGAVDLDIFGFGLGLTVDARIAADLFTPFHLRGEFSVKINLPWPLDDVGASVTLEWGIRRDPPPIPRPLQDVSIEHLKSTVAWPIEWGLLPPGFDAGDGFLGSSLTQESGSAAPGPIVPVDARPHLTFARAVHDVAGVGVNGQEPAGWETIGDQNRDDEQAKAVYSLQSLVLAKKTAGGVWTPVASAPNSGTERALFGSWAALPAIPGDPGKSAQTKLWLWNLDPFAFLRRSGSSWEDWFAESFPGYPCVPELPAREVCFGFDALAPGTAVASPWTHPGAPEVTLSWGFGPATVGTRTVTAAGVTRRVSILCFPDAAARNGVQIQSAEPSRSFRIVLADVPPQSAPGPAAVVMREIGTIDAVPTCFDVRALTAGTVANPWREEGIRFTVRGADGGLLPVGRIERWGTGALGLNAGFELDIDLPCPSSSVELIVTHRPPFRIVAFNSKGTAVATHAPQGTGDEVTETIRLEGPGMTRVVVYASGNEKLVHEVCFVCDQPKGPYSWVYDDQGIRHGPFVPDGHILTIDLPFPKITVTSDGAFCLEQICVTPDPEAGALVRRQEKIDHIREALSLWSGDAPVLEPNTEYQLTINTSAGLIGGQTWSLIDHAYFRTEGPPGLTHLAIPPGTDTTDPKKPFVTGLEDLTRYVRETDPPTVPPPGEKPLLFRPFYRGYDIGVEFNESYVEAMYRMDRRDLGFYLFTASNEPARDSRGKLLALTNHWDKTGTLTLSESRTRWLKLIDAATCLPKKPDPRTFPHDDTLTATEPDRVLAPDTLYEARLVPQLLHEVFTGGTPGFPPPGWYAVDAGPGGASLWRVMEVGEPPTWYVEQTEKIGSALEPDRPGTLLLLADPASAGWTDVRVSVYVRSPAGGAVGVVFRHGGPGNWYRFALHERLRRLVKASPSGVTLLAEDHFAWQRNRDYLLTVEAIGKSLRAYVDGEPVLAVEDGDFAAGRIGLYVCQSAGARFADVRVDDFRVQAPVLYRFQLTTSLYANFYHHLHSFEDETWPGVALGTEAAAPLTLAVTPSFDPPKEEEARAYEDLAKLALGPAPALQRSTRIEVTRLTHPGGGPLLLLRSAEPLPPQRVELELSRPPFGLTVPVRPLDLKMTEVTFGAFLPMEESVTVLIREAMAPTRHRIERRAIPGPVVEPAGDPFLLLESFEDAGALARFEVVDQGADGGPSQWQIEGGALLQTSGIQGGSEPALPGTQAIFGASGDPAWTDYRLAARLRSDAGSSVGLVFRWQDADNHYRLSADAKRGFRRLIKRQGGVVTVLWEDAVRYAPGEPFRLEVEAVGPRLAGWLDGVRLFEVMDNAHAAGRVGVYAWNDPTARCEEIEVRLPSLDARALLRDRFAAADLTGWALASESSVPLAQAAAMSLDGGALRLQSLVAQGGDPDFPGAYAVAGDAAWNDVIVRVRLRSQGGMVGVVFRGQNLSTYYRFAMSRERGLRELVRKVGGQATVLWKDNIPYEVDRPYELTVAAVGSSLRGWLDGVPLFAVEDATVPAGRIALYAWGNQEAWFSEVRVWPAALGFGGWRLDEGFAALVPGRWSFLGDSGGPEDGSWTVAADGLRSEPAPLPWEEPGGGLGGSVFALAMAGGEVYAGTEAMPAGAPGGIAVWSAGAWKPLGTGVDGSVHALAVDGDRIYAGGTFTHAGGIPARNVAFWSRSSSTWSALGGGVDGPVLALAVDGGRVYAGGRFANAGGTAAANVAVWSPQSQAWAPLGGGVDDQVQALAAAGGRLYAGGLFNRAGGKNASRVARWDGHVWAAASGAFDGPVRALAVGEGGLYIAGGFTQAGSMAANRIARWTGTAWEPLGSGLDGPVDALALEGNQVWAAGRFSQAGGAPASRIARWNRAVKAWSPVAGGADAPVHALAVDGAPRHGGSPASPSAVRASLSSRAPGWKAWTLSACPSAWSQPRTVPLPFCWASRTPPTTWPSGSTPSTVSGVWCGPTALRPRCSGKRPRGRWPGGRPR